MKNEITSVEAENQTETPWFASPTGLNFFRILGWVEGASMLILLFIAMPMKYMMGIPEATKMVGMIHGFLFLGYVFYAWQVTSELNWPMKTFFKAFVGAVLPFGTFVFGHKYLAPVKNK